MTQTPARGGRAELVVLNGRVIGLDPTGPAGDVVAVRTGRVIAVGTRAELGPLIGPATEVVDAAGGLIVPAFHDAHLHLLSYARARSRVDCRAARSIAELGAAIATRARELPIGSWVRATGYDEHRLRERRHPDRFDLDAAAPKHPVRLQHRTLHLDVLNTPALRLLGLLRPGAPGERDPLTGEPTGRLYHRGELLAEHLGHASLNEIARDVRLASERLLSLGITSIQDATVTNGPEDWELFYQLAERGELTVRTFVMAGADRWRAMDQARPPSPLVRRAQVKLMVDEATVDPAELRAAVAQIRRAGHGVAVHAVTEAELVVALDALRGTSPERSIADPRRGSGGARAPHHPRRRRRPDRIEHAAVIPDALLGELRAARVTIVAQPALVYERGDVYLDEHRPEQWGWLYRARSLLLAGIPYAVGSDAPVSDPDPMLALQALCSRRTSGGRLLGEAEALDPLAALAACTRGPARAVGMAAQLGRLRPGALADIAILDPDALAPSGEPDARHAVRLTIRGGEVVWRRPGW